MVFQFSERDPERFQEWVAHVRTAFPDLRTVRSVYRPEDRTRYVMLCYENGLEVPAWAASEGTLRLLALTILAYAPNSDQVFLIEEPENGIHPGAVESVYQSLSSVYEGQVLAATHSPVLLAAARAEEILCFTRTADGAATVVRGSEHPALQDWHNEVSLGVLLGSGVLG